MRTSVTIFAALVAAGCSSPSTAKRPEACAAADAIVAASDYSSSAVGSFAIGGKFELRFGVDLGKDPALATSHGRAFLIARDQDLIFELDPHCGIPLASRSVNNGAMRTGTTNPQDVAVAPDGSLWIARFNAPSLLVLDADGKNERMVDLSHLDADGNPNASAVRIVDVQGVWKAFVALERLDDRDGYKSKQASSLAQVDVTTLAIEKEVPLAGRNPFNLMSESATALFLAAPGNFNAADEASAGIEQFHLATSTTKLVVRETDLAGSVAEVSVTDGCGAAIVADASSNLNRTSLAIFDPETGEVLTRTLLGPTDGFDLQGLAWIPASGGKPERLLVGDRRASAGRGYPIHVFEREGAACGLRATEDSTFVPQKPIALRAAY